MSKISIKKQVTVRSNYSSAPRSLQASTQGIEKARRAFKQTLWTQEYLASEVGIQTRQPIWKFFSGKPIERHIFIEICMQLGLDWQEVATLPKENYLNINNQKQADCSDVDNLVQTVRSRRRDKIQSQCGNIRLLDVAQAIELNKIYVNVNILEALPSQSWLDISNIQGINLEKFNSFGSEQIHTDRPSALEAVVAHSKLTVLGKPGSGKTTLLQHIAMQCNQGNLLPGQIPILVRLKNFTEDINKAEKFNLLNYINQELSKSNISAVQIENLLNQGKFLFLLDGLDEVQEQDKYEVIKQICKLSEDYYKNWLIITCRITNQRYYFEGFTDIEIADFDYKQIVAFVENWFVAVGKDSREKGLAKAAYFMQKLQLSENWQIRELAGNPLLLNLACSMFQATLDFPAKRSDLYKHGLSIFLIRWNEARGINRDEYYCRLSLPHKIKLLSQIAAINFEQGCYLFTQSNVQHCIMKYLRTLYTTQTEPEVLQLDSEAVLKSISAQHGILVERARDIYSFSHLTFQEYLTAINFVSSSDQQVLLKNLGQLVEHMTEPRWREVLLLTAEMLEDADALMHLIQYHSNKLIAVEQLQHFLIWLHQKSLSIQAPYEPASIRAFYLTLTLPGDMRLARDLSLALAIDPGLAGNLTPNLTLDIALNRLLTLSCALSRTPSMQQFLALSFALPDERVVACNPELQESLQQLKEQLPALDRCGEKLQIWWSHNGQSWAQQLRSLTLQYCNIGHQWQFSEQQKEALQHYYAAQKLLMDYLNKATNVTPKMCKEIKERLLLPTGEIEHTGGAGTTACACALASVVI